MDFHLVLTRPEIEKAIARGPVGSACGREQAGSCQASPLGRRRIGPHDLNQNAGDWGIVKGRDVAGDADRVRECEIRLAAPAPWTRDA